MGAAPAAGACSHQLLTVAVRSSGWWASQARAGWNGCRLKNCGSLKNGWLLLFSRCYVRLPAPSGLPACRRRRSTTS